MKYIRGTKFWQFPASLKFITIWFFLLGFTYLRFIIILDPEGGRIIQLGNLIVGIVWCSLAIGLINRSDDSRSWAAFFVFIGSMIVTFKLLIAIFQDPNSVEGFNISYDAYPRPIVIALLIANLLFNAGILFILMRSSTKTLFSPQTPPAENH